MSSHQMSSVARETGRPTRGVACGLDEFLLMHRLGIAQDFTFDADFAAEGFEVIPAS